MQQTDEVSQNRTLKIPTISFTHVTPINFNLKNELNGGNFHRVDRKLPDSSLNH